MPARDGPRDTCAHRGAHRAADLRDATATSGATMSVAARKVVVLLATLLTIAVTARLGLWQLDRAAQKEAQQALRDARAGQPPLGVDALARDAATADNQLHRPVRLTGRWLGQFTVFLDNRQMNDAPGFFVVTPLAIGDGRDAVLVQRGWAPRDLLDRTRVPDVPTPAGPVDVVGTVAPAPVRLFEFSAVASGVIRQNLALGPFAAATGLALRPVTILQADSPSTHGDGLLRHWSRPAVDIHRNYGYAVQWFGLSLLSACLYVWYRLIRPRRAARA